MGAVAAELQSIGHRPNFFYLQHAMGLASSMGLGIALTRPELQVVVFDGDGSILMNLGGLTTLARYRPRESRARRVRQREPAVGGRIPDRDVDRQRHRGDGRGRRRAAHRAPSGRSTSSSRAFDEALAAQRADDARRQGRSRRALRLRDRSVAAREPIRVPAHLSGCREPAIAPD